MKPRAMDLNGVPQPPKMVGVMVLLDRSGSMKDIRRPMEDAFKDFVETQKAISPDGMWLTLHQFDCDDDRVLQYETVYNRSPLSGLGSLHLQPRGWTPLRDALHRFGTEARKIIDDPADNTERLLLLIVTDGQENRSHLHSWNEVRELIHGLESENCETLWFGTSDVLSEAKGQMHTFAEQGATVAYQPDAVGACYVGENMKFATAGFRSGVSARAATHSYSSGISALQAYAGPKLDAQAIKVALAKMRAGSEQKAEE